ncbi:hypothetical protein LX32DRAFT_232592 [Colletotrichum zoysiae]|uniref:Uncharacterized protein n=1 Tax=Colletotrichum zoysiae TaxID=1216348 RepID=A0AAD9H4Q5_9PEZI|nr:hypothetical protein LX32DRAFT_232592 [Colletotrichum zoysiae]
MRDLGCDTDGGIATVDSQRRNLFCLALHYGVKETMCGIRCDAGRRSRSRSLSGRTIVDAVSETVGQGRLESVPRLARKLYKRVLRCDGAWQARLNKTGGNALNREGEGGNRIEMRDE